VHVDDRDITVPGSLDVADALAEDPVYRMLGAALISPWLLGFVIVILVTGLIVFGPSSESRFIYTDF
jgi:hypothetical protein